MEFNSPIMEGAEFVSNNHSSFLMTHQLSFHNHDESDCDPFCSSLMGYNQLTPPYSAIPHSFIHNESPQLFPFHNVMSTPQVQLFALSDNEHKYNLFDNKLVEDDMSFSPESPSFLIAQTNNKTHQKTTTNTSQNNSKCSTTTFALNESNQCANTDNADIFEPNQKEINSTKILKQAVTKPSGKKRSIQVANSIKSKMNLNNTITLNEADRRIKSPKTRRKHTAIACIRCWKHKTRCSTKRPCDRCIRVGCQDECVDRPMISRKRQNRNKTKRSTQPRLTPKRKYTKRKRKVKLSEKPIQSLSSTVINTPAHISENKIEKPILMNVSLSLIMSSFRKQSNNNNLSFTYLPILTQYQISEKSYCKLCVGLLEYCDKNTVEAHLQAEHNYACPNANCDRKFLLQIHLSIHSNICKETQKLSSNLKDCKMITEMNDIEYLKCINFKIEPPIHNYNSMVCDKDTYPPFKWIDEQLKWKQMLSQLLNNNNENRFICFPSIGVNQNK